MDTGRYTRPCAPNTRRSRSIQARSKWLARARGGERAFSGYWLRARRSSCRRCCGRQARNRNRQQDGSSRACEADDRVSRRNAILAAADAESLPLADGSVSGVTMCDVVEHIDDLPSAFAEASRVTRKGGVMACAIPNRYSLAPEPHVFIWGVGWLPRRYQIPFVQWRTGKPCSHTRLPNTMEVKRLLRQHSHFKPVISAAEIPPEEISAFRGLRAILGRVYNRMVPWRIARAALVAFGPSFQLIARKE